MVDKLDNPKRHRPPSIFVQFLDILDIHQKDLQQALLSLDSEAYKQARNTLDENQLKEALSQIRYLKTVPIAAFLSSASDGRSYTIPIYDADNRLLPLLWLDAILYTDNPSISFSEFFANIGIDYAIAMELCTFVFLYTIMKYRKTISFNKLFRTPRDLSPLAKSTERRIYTNYLPVDSLLLRGLGSKRITDMLLYFFVEDFVSDILNPDSELNFISTRIPKLGKLLEIRAENKGVAVNDYGKKEFFHRAFQKFLLTITEKFHHLSDGFDMEDFCKWVDEELEKLLLDFANWDDRPDSENALFARHLLSFIDEVIEIETNINLADIPESKRADLVSTVLISYMKRTGKEKDTILIQNFFRDYYASLIKGDSRLSSVGDEMTHSQKTHRRNSAITYMLISYPTIGRKHGFIMTIQDGKVTITHPVRKDFSIVVDNMIASMIDNYSIEAHSYLKIVGEEIDDLINLMKNRDIFKIRPIIWELHDAQAELAEEVRRLESTSDNSGDFMTSVHSEKKDQENLVILPDRLIEFINKGKEGYGQVMQNVQKHLPLKDKTNYLRLQSYLMQFKTNYLVSRGFFGNVKLRISVLKDSQLKEDVENALIYLIIICFESFQKSYAQEVARWLSNIWNIEVKAEYIVDFFKESGIES